jgi:hypothetical protein
MTFVPNKFALNHKRFFTSQFLHANLFLEKFAQSHFNDRVSRVINQIKSESCNKKLCGISWAFYSITFFIFALESQFFRFIFFTIYLIQLFFSCRNKFFYFESWISLCPSPYVCFNTFPSRYSSCLLSARHRIFLSQNSDRCLPFRFNLLPCLVRLCVCERVVVFGWLNIFTVHEKKLKLVCYLQFESRRERKAP